MKNANKRAKEIVERIIKARSFEHEFALVDKNGSWRFSHYVHPVPVGKLLLAIQVVDDFTKSVMINVVSAFLKKADSRKKEN